MPARCKIIENHSRFNLQDEQACCRSKRTAWSTCDSGQASPTACSDLSNPPLEWRAAMMLMCSRRRLCHSMLYIRVNTTVSTFNFALARQATARNLCSAQDKFVLCIYFSFSLTHTDTDRQVQNEGLDTNAIGRAGPGTRSSRSHGRHVRRRYRNMSTASCIETGPRASFRECFSRREEPLCSVMSRSRLVTLSYIGCPRKPREQYGDPALFCKFTQQTAPTRNRIRMRTTI